MISYISGYAVLSLISLAMLYYLW